MEDSRQGVAITVGLTPHLKHLLRYIKRGLGLSLIQNSVVLSGFETRSLTVSADETLRVSEMCGTKTKEVRRASVKLRNGQFHYFCTAPGVTGWQNEE